MSNIYFIRTLSMNKVNGLRNGEKNLQYEEKFLL